MTSPADHDGATFTSFKLPFGVVYSANLTPDPETGLGRWSEADFIAAMRSGHHQGKGRAILPPMPWQNLSQQPESSLQAKVEPCSEELNEKLAPVSVVDACGWAVIVVSGGVVSTGSITVQLAVAGL